MLTLLTYSLTTQEDAALQRQQAEANRIEELKKREADIAEALARARFEAAAVEAEALQRAKMEEDAARQKALEDAEAAAGECNCDLI